MNVNIYCNLSIIFITVKVTINMKTLSSYEMSVIALWIGYSLVVHEVGSLHPAGGRKFFWCVGTCVTQDLCCHFHSSTCVKSTQTCGFPI